MPCKHKVQLYRITLQNLFASITMSSTANQADLMVRVLKPRPLSLPALDNLFKREEFRNDTNISGRVLSCFTYLSCYISRYSLYSLDEAIGSSARIWHRLYRASYIPETAREALESVDLAETASLIWKEAQIYEAAGLRGDDLSAWIGAIVTLEGLNLLNIRHPEDLKMEWFFTNFGAGLTQSLNEDVEQYEQRTEVIAIDAIFDPVEADGEKECLICCREEKVHCVKLNTCGHAFCKECVMNWIDGEGRGATKHCPTCRADLAKIKPSGSKRVSEVAS